MNLQVKSVVEKCPFCELPIIFREQAGFIKHLEACPLRCGGQEIPDRKNVNANQNRGPLMTRAYQKILSINRTHLTTINRKKFIDEWDRNDDYWRECMIVCPECYSFKYPPDERVRLCDCGSMMGWAKDLVENDPRFNFAKEFCAAD